MPTNPFTSSSRRKQILVPKELFPLTRATLNPDTANGKFTLSSSASSTSSSFRRPVKLPLRKHHSFHFSTSQTVSGAIKHEQFQQKHATAVATNRQGTTNERYKAQGPLVFKPFSEKSAFKPIIPSPKPFNESTLACDTNDQNTDAGKVPRICGSSLKRHISNVETFSTPQWQSDDDENNQTVMPNNNRRKIHYADLAPLPTATATATWKNERNMNGLNFDGDAGDKNSRQRLLDTSKLNEKNDLNVKNPTQYATLRFDEVNIDI